ncbi:MAG TPA: quinone-dependent dihydroorotate dehydrogenase [Phnomibacter sp.]|nr:quinone-dependent dihydroorotate dehydrogenase [Phnomibacter sp.]
MYQFIRRIFFLFPPEAVHHFCMNYMRRLCSMGIYRRVLSSMYGTEKLYNPQTVAGLVFKNHVGLGAGFDKNALYLRELEVLGFGAVEIGTVTPRPQAGNEQPRLFRLPEDKALMNRMGFNNDGVEVIAQRMAEWRKAQQQAANKQPMIIGGNIGKNKDTPNDLAYADYDACFRKLLPYVDYFVVNVSSPNTPGLRELQEKESLRKILVHLQKLRTELGVHRPIFLKIAPDLTNEQLNDVAALALEIQLDGLVATNTTVTRHTLSDAGKIRAAEYGAGGLSGAPARARATEVVAYLYARLGNKIPIIASGGIFTGADAEEKLKAGAVLVQVWTGFIYEGPSIARKIATHLLQSKK